MQVTMQGTPQRAAAQGVRSQADIAVRLLADKAGALKNEISELTARRNELASQRNTLSNDAARSHEARISIIDQRIGNLETELFATNDMLRAAEGGDLPRPVQVTTEPPRGFDPDDFRVVLQDAVFEAVGIATTSIFSMYVLWRGFRHYIWKRKPEADLRNNAAQLHQLQQSMDVIALEVERISEAQRFTAKLLSEKTGEKVPSARS